MSALGMNPGDRTGGASHAGASCTAITPTLCGACCSASGSPRPKRRMSPTRSFWWWADASPTTTPTHRCVPWIYGIARGRRGQRPPLASNARRKRRLTVVPPPPDPQTPEQQMERHQAVSLVESFIETLSPDPARGVRARSTSRACGDPKSPTALGAKLNSVYSRLRLARARFVEFVAGVDRTTPNDRRRRARDVRSFRVPPPRPKDCRRRPRRCWPSIATAKVMPPEPRARLCPTSRSARPLRAHAVRPRCRGPRPPSGLPPSVALVWGISALRDGRVESARRGRGCRRRPTRSVRGIGRRVAASRPRRRAVRRPSTANAAMATANGDPRIRRLGRAALRRRSPPTAQPLARRSPPRRSPPAAQPSGAAAIRRRRSRSTARPRPPTQTTASIGGDARCVRRSPTTRSDAQTPDLGARRPDARSSRKPAANTAPNPRPSPDDGPRPNPCFRRTSRRPHHPRA